MTRAAIYARFSSDLQRDRSIEDQIAVCRAYADRQGYEVVEVYADRAVSGASIHGRPGVQQMLEAGRNRIFDVVIAETMSRIGRDEEDRAFIRKRLTFAGVKIMTPADGEVTRLTDGIKAIIDSQYLEDLKVMVRRGMAGVTRDGRHAGGRAYGYRPILGRPGELEIVEEEAAVVRRIFTEFAAGKKPRDIAHGLNVDGIAAPRGLRWSASTLSGNKLRGHGILVNPLYGGEIVWNRIRMVKDPDTGKRVSRVNPVSEWQRAPAPHLAIVPPEVFDQVQAALGTLGQRKAWQSRKTKHLLSGLLRCGCCGAGMSIKDKSGGRTRVQCTGAKEGSTCTNTRAFYLDNIEKIVLAGLKAKLGSRAAIARYMKTFNAERHALAADTIGRRNKAEARLARLDAEHARTVGMLVKGVLKEETGAAELRRIEAERDALKAEIETMGERPKLIELHPAAVEEYLATVAMLEDALRSGATEPAALRPVRQLIDTVTVTPDGKEMVIDLEGTMNRLIGGNLYPTMKLGGLMVAEVRYMQSPQDVPIRFAFSGRARNRA